MGPSPQWATAWVLLASFALGPPAGAQPRAAQSEGRRLDEALAELQRRGLKVIFSSEVVPSSMRVTEEPRLPSPRRVLDALLEPHGLIAQDGPGGTLLVVKNPRARLLKRPAPVVVAPLAPAEPVGTTEPPPRYAETILVVDEAESAVTGGSQSRTLRSDDVRDFAGGFENVFRTITALPGITATDELGSRLAVRGGAPDQNLTVMDGIEIHNPFRLIVPSEDLALVGLASTFNPDTVERVEFSPGAFDVPYGDRLSALLVVKSRDGSQAEAFQGAASVGLGDANLTIEGKLPRRLDGSWLVSARRTYLGLFAERMTSTTLPTFTDVQARATWALWPGRRLSLVTLAGRERLRGAIDATADAGATTATDNSLIGLTFESSLGQRGFSRTVASHSRFRDALDAYERSFDNSRGANTPASIDSGGLLQFQVSRRIEVADLALRQDLMFVLSARHWLELGAEAHALDTGWSWNISGDRSLQQANGSSLRLGAALPSRLNSSRQSWRAGVWLKDRWQVAARVVLEPGVRLDHDTITDAFSLSPRLSATAQLGGAWRLDGAVRLHAQSPGYEKMLQSDYFVDLSPPASRGLGSEGALQTALGVQRSLPGGFTVRVDAYFKRYDALIVGRLETDGERLARLDTYDVPAELWPQVATAAQITARPVNAGRGHAYGMEAQVSRLGGSGRPVTGWISYSFGDARRIDYGVTRPFDYDRRHGLTAAANVRLGPRLDLSVTARAASGLPRTPVQGVRLSLVEDTADADNDGNRSELLPQRDAQGAPLFQPDYGDVGRLNSARLPHFGRVDARLTYRPAWGGERWAFYADVINLFNGRNVTQIDSRLAVDPGTDRPRIIEVAQDRGIPLFASIGLRFWF
jgi:hypothetical protein